jgi:hypothetical protein
MSIGSTLTFVVLSGEKRRTGRARKPDVLADLVARENDS